jgi:hypothetical protein
MGRTGSLCPSRAELDCGQGLVRHTEACSNMTGYMKTLFAVTALAVACLEQ